MESRQLLRTVVGVPGFCMDIGSALLNRKSEVASSSIQDFCAVIMDHDASGLLRSNQKPRRTRVNSSYGPTVRTAAFTHISRS